MKKIITIISAVLLWSNASSQVNDSVSMGNLYTNQVFYSLDNGEVSNIDNNNWELGFSMSGNGAAGSAIVINEATTILWAYPGDTADWNAFDTSNFASWERLLNTDTSWTNGAFNVHRGASGVFDMGWGVLNPANNFWAFGDSLYLAKLSDNSYRKIWVVSLKTGIWEFKYANVDGSNEQTFTIDKANFINRNFVYHSMLTNTTINREPDNTTWDLTFAKHTDYVFPPGLYVPVTGVFNNRNVWSAKSQETSFTAASTSTTPQTTFNQNITNIGRGWKKHLGGGVFSVNDSLAYFIYDNDSSDFYRIVFTDFEGSSTGKAFFTKELLQTVSVKSFNQTMNFSFYPNPATKHITLLLDYPKAENISVKIIDLSGKLVYNETLSLSKGINQKRLSINYLTSGIYILNLKNEKFYTSQKLIVR